MKPDDIKKLKKLGAEKLAEALVHLASVHEAVADYVETLIADQEDLTDIFKARLKSIKGSRRFIHYRETFGVSKELDTTLQGITASVKDTKACLELITAFIETDNSVYGRCDDSSGCIADSYRNACKVFADYAAKLNDEKYVEKVFCKLVAKNDYGTRDPLGRESGKFFSQATLTRLVNMYIGDENKHFKCLAMEMAKNFDDTNAYEAVLVKNFPVGNEWVDFYTAQHLMAHNRLEEAVERLRSIKDSWYERRQRDDLLQQLYSQLGKNDELFSLSRQRLLKELHVPYFDEMVNLAGEDKREAMLKEITDLVLKTEHEIYRKIGFFLETRQADIAARLVREHIAEINGEFYTRVLPLAESFEPDYPLEASLLYRTLVEGNLRPAQSVYYQYGVKYLRKTDVLAVRVTDWKGFPSHDEFKAELKQKHKLKSSFWSKYQG